MTKEIKRLTSLAVIVAMLVLAVPVAIPQTATKVEAATKKTTLDTSSEQLGIGWTYDIKLKNKNSKATYTYKSNKASVAKVSKKGRVTALKPGTTYITVKQKLKGKTTTVGKLELQVMEASIDTYFDELENCVSTQDGMITDKNPMKLYFENNIKFKNMRAVYTCYSNDSDLVITPEGLVTAVKSEGISTITVKETYKNKTRSIGELMISRKNPLYLGPNTFELEKNDTITVDDFLYATGKYKVVCQDKEFTNNSDNELLDKYSTGDENISSGKIISIKTKYLDEKVNVIKAKSSGAQYCALMLYNYNTQKYDKILYKFRVVVK